MARSLSTDWLADAAEARPDAIALRETNGDSRTFAELDHEATRAAAALRSVAGVEAGASIGVEAPTTSDTVAALWGSWRLGAVPLPLDPRRTDLGDVAGAESVRAVVGKLPSSGGDGPARRRVDPEAAHSLVLTSGSKGARKAVILSNANVHAAVAASHRRLGNGPEDRWLLTLPLFHIGGLSILWRSAAAGGTVLLQSEFDAVEAAAALATGRATFASFVPTMLLRVLDAHPGPYERVQAVLLGGAPAPVALVDRALDAGLPVLQTYGSTEACSQIATVAPGRAREDAGTVGKPLDGLIVSVIGSDGRPRPQGSAGEITIDGPSVFTGYLGERTRNGAHPTGDIGRFTDRGTLVVTGRTDRAIHSGGEIVQPERIEQVVEDHPGVAGCAVVGLPDSEWGSEVVAVVAGSDLEESSLIAWVRTRLFRYEMPRRWVLVARLPLLPNGKVDDDAVVVIAAEAP